MPTFIYHFCSLYGGEPFSKNAAFQGFPGLNYCLLLSVSTLFKQSLQHGSCFYFIVLIVGDLQRGLKEASPSPVGSIHPIYSSF